jgi:hypothetical protein
MGGLGEEFASQFHCINELFTGLRFNISVATRYNLLPIHRGEIMAISMYGAVSS